MENMLVTGLSGLIGSAARPLLQDHFNLTALNRSSVPGVDTIQTDLSTTTDLGNAFAGQDVVVHLAAEISDDVGWDALHSLNIVGTRTVFEAAKMAGVKHVVYASSGATVAGWESQAPYKSIVEGRYDEVPANWPLINEQMPVRPGNLYASTKVWGEALARHYAQSAGMTFVCLRIGFVNAQDRPTNPRQFAVWLSQNDVTRALLLAANYRPLDGVGTFFVNSANRWGYRDLQHAADALHFVPEDEAESHRARFEARVAGGHQDWS